MVPTDSRSTLEFTQQLRIAQIIVLALSVSAFSASIILAVLAGWPQPAAQPLVAYAGLVGAGLALVGRFVARLITERQALRLAEALYRGAHPTQFQQTLLASPAQEPPSGAARAFFQLFQNQLLFGLCILESGVFLNLVAYFWQKQVYSLVAAGILIVYMLLHCPTGMTYQNWTRRIADRAIRQARQVSGT